MNKLKQSLQKLLNAALKYFPRKLPLGRSEFETWSSRILSMCPQFADLRSMRFVLATELMRLEKRVKSVPDEFFVRALHVAGAKQVGGMMFQEMKLQQQEEMKAAQQAEATAAQASDGTH